MINHNDNFGTFLRSSQVLYDNFEHIDQVEEGGSGVKDGSLSRAELQRIVDTTDDDALRAAARYFLRHEYAFNIVENSISGGDGVSKNQLEKAATGEVLSFEGFIQLAIENSGSYDFNYQGRFYSIVAVEGQEGVYQAIDNKTGHVVDKDIELLNEGTPGFIEISNELGRISGLGTSQSLYVGGSSADSTQRLVLVGSSAKVAQSPYDFIYDFSGSVGTLSLEDYRSQQDASNPESFEDWLSRQLDSGKTVVFTHQGKSYSLKKVGDLIKAYKEGSKEPIDENVKINQFETRDGWVEIAGVQGFEGASGTGRLFLGAEPEDNGHVFMAHGDVSVNARNSRYDRESNTLLVISSPSAQPKALSTQSMSEQEDFQPPQTLAQAKAWFAEMGVTTPGQLVNYYVDNSSDNTGLGLFLDTLLKQGGGTFSAFFKGMSEQGYQEVLNTYSGGSTPESVTPQSSTPTPTSKPTPTSAPSSTPVTPPSQMKSNQEPFQPPQTRADALIWLEEMGITTPGELVNYYVDNSGDNTGLGLFLEALLKQGGGSFSAFFNGMTEQGYQAVLNTYSGEDTPEPVSPPSSTPTPTSAPASTPAPTSAPTSTPAPTSAPQSGGGGGASAGAPAPTSAPTPTQAPATQTPASQMQSNQEPFQPPQTRIDALNWLADKGISSLSELVNYYLDTSSDNSDEWRFLEALRLKGGGSFKSFYTEMTEEEYQEVRNNFNGGGSSETVSPPSSTPAPSSETGSSKSESNQYTFKPPQTRVDALAWLSEMGITNLAELVDFYKDNHSDETGLKLFLDILLLKGGGSFKAFYKTMTEEEYQEALRSYDLGGFDESTGELITSKPQSAYAEINRFFDAIETASQGGNKDGLMSYADMQVYYNNNKDTMSQELREAMEFILNDPKGGTTFLFNAIAGPDGLISKDDLNQFLEDPSSIWRREGTYVKDPNESDDARKNKAGNFMLSYLHILNMDGGNLSKQDLQNALNKIKELEELGLPVDQDFKNMLESIINNEKGSFKHYDAHENFWGKDKFDDQIGIGDLRDRSGNGGSRRSSSSGGVPGY